MENCPVVIALDETGPKHAITHRKDDDGRQVGGYRKASTTGLKGGRREVDQWAWMILRGIQRE
jgi:hypothetical protein